MKHWMRVFGVLALLIIVGFGLVVLWGRVMPPTSMKDQSVAGWQFRSQQWDGIITVKSDTLFMPWTSLMVRPGTKVLFEQEPQEKGMTWTPYADVFIKEHNDPTGTKEYQRAHFGLTGKIIALGTPEAPILITSAREEPDYADWDQITLFKGSRLEYVQVSYAHNGVTVEGDGVVVRHSKFRDSLWSCVDIFSAGNTIENNEIYHCWHQAVGVKNHSGNIIRNNFIHDAWLGVNCEYGATPTIIDNRFVAAPLTSDCPLGAGNTEETRPVDTRGGTYSGKLVYPAQQP